MPVTETMLDSMTDDIYDRVEADGRINIEVEVQLRDSDSDSSESRQMSRPRPRRRNRFLRDLIRILLIRELLGRRRPRFPFRPF